MGDALWASCWVLIQEGAAADVHAETKLGFYTVVVMGMEGAAAPVLLAVAVPLPVLRPGSAVAFPSRVCTARTAAGMALFLGSLLPCYRPNLSSGLLVLPSIAPKCCEGWKSSDSAFLINKKGMNE